MVFSPYNNYTHTCKAWLIQRARLSIAFEWNKKGEQKQTHNSHV